MGSVKQMARKPLVILPTGDPIYASDAGQALRYLGGAAALLLAVWIFLVLVA